MNVFIKNRKRRVGEFQFFMHQFVESCIKSGIPPKRDFKINKLTKLLSIVFVKLPHRKKKNAIIISTQGSSLLYNTYPYFGYEIIPMIWDLWPGTWPKLYRHLTKLKCKTAFVTVRSMAEKLRSDLGINAYWISEGIDVNDYSKGVALENRSIDVYELGRQLPRYHNILIKILGDKLIRNTYNPDGTLAKLAYPTSEELLDKLNKTKIIISFPQVDTHPQRAGKLETLTQRYWEAMLSGCLIIGRAPKELIDLFGYNPVIDVDWKNPEEQILNILNNIGSFQTFVDRNHDTAKKMASWDLRIQQIKNILYDEGYLIGNIPQ